MEIINQYFGDFTPVQMQQWAGLQELYREWNEKINVISRKDMEHFYEHHVLHSLAIATQFDFSGLQVMDLGCGGGFPGVPLAIFFPQAQFHLVDSINKKLKVVEAVAQGLGITNITTQHSRAEEVKGRQFDVVVSRAVAPLGSLWQWCRPQLKKAPKERDASGLICLKGGDLAQEIVESGCKPRVWELEKLYTEHPYFAQKYLLQVPY